MYYHSNLWLSMSVQMPRTNVKFTNCLKLKINSIFSGHYFSTPPRKCSVYFKSVQQIANNSRDISVLNVCANTFNSISHWFMLFKRNLLKWRNSLFIEYFNSGSFMLKDHEHLEKSSVLHLSISVPYSCGVQMFIILLQKRYWKIKTNTDILFPAWGITTYLDGRSLQ